jgi:nucleotide-binding universal stress UspA family protein
MRHGAPLTTVLVPLDGSWRSEAALVPAVPIARRTGARLVLLSTQWSASDLGTTRNYLEGRRAGLFDLGFDGECGIEAVVERDAATAIVAAAAAPGTLVCMATHGHGGVIRGVLGSVAEAVVRGAVAPVVLVGPSLDPQWRLAAMPDALEIVVALDGSPTAREAIPAAVSLARAIDGGVRVVHVPHPDGLPVEDLGEVLATFAAAGIDASVEFVDGFDPAGALAEVAAQGRVAFLVAATHGRTGLARVTLGSVVQRLVRRAPCPVVVVRPTVLTEMQLSVDGQVGATTEEGAHARRGWRRDRGRPQPSRSAAPQG